MLASTLKLSQQAIHDDLQMQFSHTGDDRLARFLVAVHSERWILFRQALQGNA